MILETILGRRCLSAGALMLFGFGAGVAFADSASSGNLCIPKSEPTTLETGEASAGYISNITNSSGSISAQSHKMLTSALESARSKNPPNWVKFTAIPTMAKDPGDALEMCSREEQATRNNPLVFDDKRFESVDDLTSWIMDFTRGKGDEGALLYERCPGRCSPQYTWWIEPHQNGVTVKPSAVCGLPRDRDGNMYKLTTAIASPCAD